MAKARTIRRTCPLLHKAGVRETSQGRGNVSTSTMNKNQKANYKKYRGQGK
jgi:hypothetical protein